MLGRQRIAARTAFDKSDRPAQLSRAPVSIRPASPVRLIRFFEPQEALDKWHLKMRTVDNFWSSHMLISTIKSAREAWLVDSAATSSLPTRCPRQDAMEANHGPANFFF